MRMPFVKLPKCEICHSRIATRNARCRFENWSCSVWVDICPECAEKYQDGQSTPLKTREKDWKPEPATSPKQRAKQAVASADVAKAAARPAGKSIKSDSSKSASKKKKKKKPPAASKKK